MKKVFLFFLLLTLSSCGFESKEQLVEDKEVEYEIVVVGKRTSDMMSKTEDLFYKGIRTLDYDILTGLVTTSSAENVRQAFTTKDNEKFKEIMQDMNLSYKSGEVYDDRDDNSMIFTYKGYSIKDAVDIVNNNKDPKNLVLIEKDVRVEYMQEGDNYKISNLLELIGDDL